MNIFFLDNNPKVCAEYHNDIHCNKMILESAQLLLTTYCLVESKKYVIKDGFIIYQDQQTKIYKPTHTKHPCTLWLLKSKQNWIWLYSLLFWLEKEKVYRTSKRHKSKKIVLDVLNLAGLPCLPNVKRTPPALAMPNEYKTIDPVESYRNYYRNDKKHLAKWTKRKRPEWW